MRTTLLIRSHKELRVWQEAMDLAMEIFHATKTFPKEETYSLTDQKTVQAMDERYERLLAQLVTMANHPEKWTT